MENSFKEDPRALNGIPDIFSTTYYTCLFPHFDPHNYSLSWSLNLGKRQARHRDRFNSLPAARPDVRVWGRRLTLALQVKISLSGPVFSGARGRAWSSLRARNPAPLSCDLRRSSAGDRVLIDQESARRRCGSAGTLAMSLQFLPAPATPRVSPGRCSVATPKAPRQGGTGRRRAAALLHPVSVLQSLLNGISISSLSQSRQGGQPRPGN
ncbi:uncharacterized protein LOC112618685 [Theropithecus gelada]|uniref:uncharacterized protein LOC112618685 n=1 Tax=Theropithecus gelada TaxID=9565 RepID=UPI000DC1A3A4|nr:uncharacterized protein LOC112618685 [Theropithecus gelada]